LYESAAPGSIPKCQGSTTLALTYQFFICDQAESDSEFDKRYEAYFNRADIDGWEIRKVILLIFTVQ
jgi:hypothetical protein